MPKTMTKEEQVAHLEKLVNGARTKLESAKKFADKHGLSFVWDQTYGSSMQEYLGKGTEEDEYNYDTKSWGKVVLEEGKWTSSSEGC